MLVGEGVVVACGDTELYPLPKSPGIIESEDMDRGVPVSCFNESLLA